MASKKIALISGVTGQDGAFLSHLLLEKGYEVHGIRRRSSSFNTARIDSIHQDVHVKGAKFFLHYGDLTDALSLNRILQQVAPTEIYNLAAQSHVSVSFLQPHYTFDANANGVTFFLDLLLQSQKMEETKFYQASTSELFGAALAPQCETTAMMPQSPYAVSKLAAYWMVKNYREGYGLHASNGILFNHESQLRGETFVTRKITLGLSRIKLGFQEKLYLGNLDSLRDWGHARDYVEAQYLIMQQDASDDYVIATGKQYSVRDFVNQCCDYLDINLSWQGQGKDERGIDEKTGKVVIEVDPIYYRPLEVNSLLGDSSKAREILGWEPRTGFENLVIEMLQYDLKYVAGQFPEIKWTN
jgi:GDPmannose 4,6-dehydratase